MYIQMINCHLVLLGVPVWLLGLAGWPGYTVYLCMSVCQPASVPITLPADYVLNVACRWLKAHNSYFRYSPASTLVLPCCRAITVAC